MGKITETNDLRAFSYHKSGLFMFRTNEKPETDFLLSNHQQIDFALFETKTE